MTKEELKQQAHKEFDELGIWNFVHGEMYITKDTVPIVKSFIDSLIDRTVQMTEERIVGCIEKEMRLGRLFPSTTCHQIISIITNKSDINK